MFSLDRNRFTSTIFGSAAEATFLTLDSADFIDNGLVDIETLIHGRGINPNLRAQSVIIWLGRWRNTTGGRLYGVFVLAYVYGFCSITRRARVTKLADERHRVRVFDSGDNVVLDQSAINQ